MKLMQNVCRAKEFYRLLAYVQHPWGRIVVILIMFAPIRVGSHTQSFAQGLRDIGSPLADYLKKK